MHSSFIVIVELRKHDVSFHSYHSCNRKGPPQNTAPLTAINSPCCWNNTEMQRVSIQGYSPQAAFCHLWMIKKLKALDTEKEYLKKYLWERKTGKSSLKIQTESEPGNTSFLESVFRTLGPTNITNLHLHNFCFAYMILLRTNSKRGKQHGRYVPWSHTYGIMLRELHRLKQCLFCVLYNDYKN